jgi:putative glycosyltransferase (TIGR04372 family)
VKIRQEFFDRRSRWSILSRLRKLLPIIIQTPAVEAFGNCADEIYWGLLRARREKRKVIFVFLRDINSWGPFVFSKRGLGINKTLTNVVSPHRALNEHNLFVIGLTWLLTFSYCICRLVGLICLKLEYKGGRIPKQVWSTRKSTVKLSLKKPGVGLKGLWPHYLGNSQCRQSANPWANMVNDPLLVDLNKEDHQKGRTLATQMGLPVGVRYACLHVRETGFYGPDESQGKVNRNGLISNYLPAIQYLLDQGIWVVRLGDPTMTRLPNMDRVIDYPFSSYKSDLMDIWLIKNCDLYIGTDSGPVFVAILFHKPIVLTNIVDFCFGYPTRIHDIGILKHAFSTKKDEYLPAKEIIDRSLRDYNDWVNDADISFVENTENEILSIVCESVESGFSSNPGGHSRLQDIVLERRRALSEDVNWIKKCNELERGRLLAVFHSQSGALSENYLQNNFFVDSLNGVTSGAVEK